VSISFNIHSISLRLATRATKEIKETEIAKSKKGLLKNIRIKHLLTTILLAELGIALFATPKQVI